MRRFIIALGGIILFAGTAQAEEDCRRYKDEIRVGGGMSDTYETKCRDEKGDYTKKHDPYEGGGYFIRPQDSSDYQPARDNRAHMNNNTHTHHFDDRYDTRVILGGGSGVPIVVVNPFNGHQYRGSYDYGRNWSPSQQNFQYHHGGTPGWQKHWKHHQRAMNGGGDQRGRESRGGGSGRD